jgi:2-oxoglutarate dehydrogenase E2 component (dihydrolipoamide succinyltransferase)
VTQDEAPAEKERRASPSARRLARERDVDLDEVARESGRDRLTREDVERFVDDHESAGDERTRGDESGERGQPDDTREELVRMSGRRRTIARRLVEAQRNAAMLTTFNEIDMSSLLELRRRQKASFIERHGVSLGIVSFFVRASVAALHAFPRLNAEVRGDSMLLKRHYDIGVAVGDPEGLVVPIIRDADRLSLAQIERRIKKLVAKADDERLSAEDLSGGTFTITNGGVFGSLLSTPILNPPQVGILGLHKIEERPVALDARIQIRPMMYVALSYDHRIVDGLEAVQFLGRVKELIESSEKLLLEG